MEDNRTASTAVVVLQFLGYFLVFAIPTATVAILLPQYAPGIVIGGTSLFLATTGFILGWQWDDEWPPEARRHITRVLLIFIGYPVVKMAVDTAHRPDDLAVNAIVLVLLELGVTMATLPSFYLGRAMHRRKTAGT
ncbi:MAG: hypothetical protein KBC96_00890 [Armatimonadetes bacterium]|nr:hypothetical protein [Armatimonadota bacterium]